MAGSLSPLDRPDGSTQVLRYRGVVITAPAQASGVYPKTNASIPTDSAIVGQEFIAWVRFALFDPGFASPPADPAAVANPLRKYPEFVFDDSQLAGTAPHPAVPSVLSPTAGINASDLSLHGKTWAQNIDIKYVQIDPNVHIADVGLYADGVDSNAARVLLDTATVGGVGSGLGLGTGLPVVAIRFVVATNGQTQTQPFSVDITFEIRHTEIR